MSPGVQRKNWKNWVKFFQPESSVDVRGRQEVEGEVHRVLHPRGKWGSYRDSAALSLLHVLSETHDVFASLKVGGCGVFEL